MNSDLNRFLTAQQGGVYENALADTKMVVSTVIGCGLYSHKLMA